MKRFLTIAFFLLLVVNIGCKKKDNPLSQNTATIVADKPNYYQYEIATFTAEYIEFKEASYDAIINGEKIKMVAFENRLGLLIPEIAPGSYSIQSTIEGKDYSINITINELPTVMDVDVVINKITANMDMSATGISNLNLQTSTLPGSEYDKTNEAILNDYYNKFSNTLKGANQEEKLGLAKFVTANPFMFTTSEDPALSIDSLNIFKTTSEEDIEKSLDDLVEEAKKRVDNLLLQAAVIEIVGLVPAIIKPKAAKLILTVTQVPVIYLIWKNGKWLQIQFNKTFLLYKSLLQESTRKQTSGYEFENEKEYTISFNANYRNFYKDDMTSTSVTLVSLINSLDMFGNICDKINKLLTIPLVGKPFHIKNVQNYQQKKLHVNGKYLSLENISNPKVQAIVNNSNGDIKVIFKTSETTDQDFNYDIVYNNPNVLKKSTTFSGKVKGGNLLDGIWTLNLTLGTGNCDETLLEDELGIPPTLHFNADWTITFDTDPVGSDLNGSNFSNGYDYFDNTHIKIWSTYNDGTDNILFQCDLIYNNQTQKFAGTYTNQWTDGTICTNSVELYK